MRELWVRNQFQPVKNDKGEIIHYGTTTKIFVPKNGVIQDIIDAYGKAENLSDTDKIEMFSSGDLLSPSRKYNEHDISKFQNHYHIHSRINFEKTDTQPSITVPTLNESKGAPKTTSRSSESRQPEREYTGLWQRPLIDWSRWIKSWFIKTPQLPSVSISTNESSTATAPQTGLWTQVKNYFVSQKK
jgi:hypothetical protein